MRSTASQKRPTTARLVSGFSYAARPLYFLSPAKKKGEARGVTIIQSVPRWQVNKLVTRHQKISILFIFKVTRVKKFVEVGKRVRWTTVQQLAKKIYLQRKRRHCPVIPLCL